LPQRSADGGSAFPMSAFPSLAGEVWVCPAPVLMTADDIAAALYAFSDLIADCADPSSATVRDEIRFLVAKYGTDSIERVADELASCGPEPLPSFPAGAQDASRSTADRLVWCRRQAAGLLAADDSCHR
jgi:hypothetical protein